MRIFSILFLAVTIFLFSCGKSGKRSETSDLNLSSVILLDDAEDFLPGWSEENRVIMHISSEPDNLHPTNGNSLPRLEINNYIHGFILRSNLEGEGLVAELAEKLPDVSEDGLSFMYKLKSNLTWDNGQLLSPSDVIFTAKAQKCLYTNNHAGKSYWNKIETITADSLDPLRFTIRMKEKNIQNIAFLFSFPIMQESFHDPNGILRAFDFSMLDDSTMDKGKSGILQQWATQFNDDKYGRIPEHINGIGPYKVKHWEPGQYVELVRKQKHWNPELQLMPDKITYKVNKDENSTLLEFRNQSMDASMSLSTGTFLELASDSSVRANYHLILTNSYNYTYLAFNMRPLESGRLPLFDDHSVRKSLAGIVPVDKLIKVVYKDYSSQCKRMATNVSPLKKEFNPYVKPLPYDPLKSSQQMKNAGWKDSDMDGVLDKVSDGKKISFEAELIYLNTGSDWKDMAMLITEEFGKHGIKVYPIAADIRTFVQRARAREFDLLLGSWGANALPEDFTQLWHSSSWKNNGSNYSGFGNDLSDALIDSIRTELDQEKRIRMVHRLQEIIIDEQPAVFLYTSLRRNIVHKRFGNVKLYADRPGILLNDLRLLSVSQGKTSP
ncbi:MAG: hypothetical protein DWQ48_07395 [Bacteroidetes bacterium]|nr:MAG: hypothetical protein DWQ48_07395 [Bacteroidota bacterium]